MKKFDYEVEALTEDEDKCPVMCDESEADYWGVYERPVEPDGRGARLAVWIADFARKEDAQVFRDLMEDVNKVTHELQGN